MRHIPLGVVGAILLAGTCASAQPFSQLKFDVNKMEAKFWAGPNGSGASLPTVTAGGGLSFTGSWEFTFGQAFFPNNAVQGNNLSGGAGPFSFAGNATLTSVTGFINFQNGVLVDGSFAFGVANNAAGTDIVQGALGNSGTSQLLPLGSAYFVDGLVVSGLFTDSDTDNTFGSSVDISLFQNVNFFGTFAALFVSNDGSNADYDMVIEIPAPASAVGVLAVGVFAARRRRS